MPEQLSTCMSCKYDGLDFPCRNEHGHLNFKLLSNELFKWFRYSENEIPDDKLPWIYECLDELVDHSPKSALQLILSALPRFKENADIAVLAAGPMESLLIEHGDKIIESIEREASKNVRFRLLLSGVWGQDQMDADVWRRLQVAVAPGPWLGRDPRTPQGSDP